jgi:transposase
LQNEAEFGKILYNFNMIIVFEGLMNYNFRSYNPKQPYLLPPSLDDWLPQEHLARFISETVDQMDLSALIKAYRANGQGSAAYHPAMMVKALLYAYCIGIPSSRKIAKALVDDVAFRWLAASNFPDFRTISGFRRRHLKALQDLFPQILLLCKASGLVKAGIIALDGTKVKTNASLSRNKTYEQLSTQGESGGTP